MSDAIERATQRARDVHRRVGRIAGASNLTSVAAPSLAARARGKVLGRQLGQCRLAPKVLALVDAGQSYRLIGRELGLSKNTVADIVKRRRVPNAGSSVP
jgi:DNA-binding NarL/FixJ family response regulator